MKNEIILEDLDHLPLGTLVTIWLNKAAFVRAVSFGSNFGLQSGEIKRAWQIKKYGWKVVLGWN